MGAIAHLEDANKKLVVANIFEKQDGDNLTDAIKDIAGNIIDDIRELPKPSKP